MIRLATRDDVVAIHAIYSHYVRTSTCTFQTIVSPIEQQMAWFDDHDDTHPVIVDEHESQVRAWGSLSIWNRREGYSRTVESSIYVHPEHHRKGLGRALVTDLITRAKDHGFHVLLAGISADQNASIALHQSLGFVERARLPELGYKFDRWIDVIYMSLFL